VSQKGTPWHISHCSQHRDKPAAQITFEDNMGAVAVRKAVRPRGGLLVQQSVTNVATMVTAGVFLIIRRGPGGLYL
jgi:hypothetical protein